MIPIVLIKEKTGDTKLGFSWFASRLFSAFSLRLAELWHKQQQNKQKQQSSQMCSSEQLPSSQDKASIVHINKQAPPAKNTHIKAILK